MARRVFLLAALLCTSTATQLDVDLSGANLARGRRFDGVGGLSGGGATSVLLQSYPEKQRGEILDLLFNRSYGASLHILKVEIGGDGDSTEGSESSHEHTKGAIDCHRGYEWQLMKEARARNPNILLYGLPWSFPAWLRGTNRTQFVNVLENLGDTTQYMVDWVACAEGTHGLTIDLLGVWNEKDDEFAAAGVAYIKALRHELDRRGYGHVRLIAGDVHSWAPEDQLLVDPDLKKAVDVLCRHYPSTDSDPAAKKTGKPLWSSEDYAASNSGSGGRCEARILNQNWVRGLISATINWNLISAYYDYVAWPDDGFSMTARWPWSGHYEVQPPLWAAAHTSQFADPGHVLLPNGTGSALLGGGGSVVSYANTDAARGIQELAVVVEKVQPGLSSCGFSQTPQYTVQNETLELHVHGGSATIERLYVWRSNFAAGRFFEAQGFVIADANNIFRIEVGVDDVLTLTSSANRGHKGGVNPTSIPAAAPFPQSYEDDFRDYANGANAAYLTAMSGAFEVYNGVLQQTAVGFPTKWLRDDLVPFAVLGDGSWRNARVGVSFTVDAKGGGAVFVGSGLTAVGTDASGLLLAVDERGGVCTWYVATAVHDIGAAAQHKNKWLASGSCKMTTTAQWHNLTLDAGVDAIVGTLDNLQLFSLPRSALGISTVGVQGAACIGTDGYYTASFNSLHVHAAGRSVPTPAPAPPTPAPPPPATQCKEISSGQRLRLAGCGINSTDEHQSWAIYPDGTLGTRARPDLGLCAVVAANGSGGGCSGACLELGPCDRGVSFAPLAGDNKVHVRNDTRCLDVDEADASKNALELYTCNDAFHGGLNQQFEYDEATGILTSKMFASETACVVVCDVRTNLY